MDGSFRLKRAPDQGQPQTLVCPFVKRIDQAWTQVIVWPGMLSMSMTSSARCNTLKLNPEDLQHTEPIYERNATH